MTSPAIFCNVCGCMLLQRIDPQTKQIVLEDGVGLTEYVSPNTYTRERFEATRLVKARTEIHICGICARALHRTFVAGKDLEIIPLLEGPKEYAPIV